MQATSIYAVGVFQVCKGQIINNILHYRPVDLDPPGIAEVSCTSFLSEFREGWEDGVLPSVSPDLTVVQYSCVEIEQWLALPDVVTGTRLRIRDIGTTNPDPPTPGEYGAEEFVNSTFDAYGIKKITNQQGRTWRGSMRIAGVPDSVVADNAILPGVATTLRTNLLASLRVLTIGTTAGDINFVMSVFSRKVFENPEPVAVQARTATAPVLGMTVNPFITSQVSRKARPAI